MRRALAGALIGLLLLVGSAVAAVVPVPPLTARVTDQTGSLDSDQTQALETKLAAFEHSKGSQFAVLIVPTTGDETIEQFSIRVTDVWKLGRKGVDDGALLLIAKDDRRARIEVGRGLEGVIPDAIANRIIDEDLRPKFREGDFAGGLQAAVDRMIGLVNGEALPPPKPEAEFDTHKADQRHLFNALIAAFFIANALRQLLAGVAPIGRASVTGVVVTVAVCLLWSFGLLALGLGVFGFLFGLIPSGSGRFAGSGGYGGWGGGWGGGSGGGGGFGGGFSGGGGGFSGGGASGGW
ncbi:MAG TPA: YgcG family protein [Xanthomonadaceae bacterium]|nr:YgcG family protein [Xanthomonadaceae bacterium]